MNPNQNLKDCESVGPVQLTSSSEHSSLSILVRSAIIQSAEASCSGGADRGEERADTARPITGDA